MKKFFVGLLSLFLLLGAGVLSACGKGETNLKLSKETVAIQIYSEEEEGYEIVTATMEGTDKASISANAKSGYENIVKVTTSVISDTKVSIKIEGLNEGDAEIAVKSGKHTKYIHATVYSEVSEMKQVVEDGQMKNNFLIRGQENILLEEELIEFTPSIKSRRNITWALEESSMALSLEANKLTIGNNFVGDSVSLIATTEKGVTANIILPVVDKISDDVALSFSYSKNAEFEKIDEENNSFNIVPNLPTNAKYQGYVLIGYNGELDITGYALDANGNVTDDIVVSRDGSHLDAPLFVIYANKENTNINQDYTIGFRIGYTNYNYALDTMVTNPIKIIAREVINGVIVSTYGAGNIENTTQTLYSQYGDSDYSTAKGQSFEVSMIPTTVFDASGKYSITLTREEAGGVVADGCPIEISYRDQLNGGIWTTIPLVAQDGVYTTVEANPPSATTIYIKAVDGLQVQTATGFKLTFTSCDNPDVSTSFNLKLVKSVALEDFKFPNGNFVVDSSKQNVTLKKEFTLNGQTSIDGLYIINNSKAVTFDEIHYVTSDEQSVTFEVALTLKKSSYGVTTLDSYYMAHKNGLISEELLIDIFLPLKEASVYVDRANDLSNSIINAKYNKNTYDGLGQPLESATSESLSVLMLKNNSTTPISFVYNEINNISAVAAVKAEFFTFDETKHDLDAFINLANTPAGILEILNNAWGNDASVVAELSKDMASIITHSTGHAYMVLSFTGKGTENVDENGNVTLIRVIRIESLVTPDGMSVHPESDKDVSLYSIESLATSDENLTEKDISISFENSNVSYTSITNLKFTSRNKVAMGEMTVSGDGSTVAWERGRYTLSNIVITSSGISFTISALHTYGDYIFADTLDLNYIVYNADEEKVYDIGISIKITIKNAQRIESVVWENYDSDGIYFEVGDTNPQYLLFKTNPTNSKNKSMAYVLTDKDGVADDSFVEVSDAVSSEILSVNLSERLTEGKTGYIYVLPADAIYNNQIKYYYLDGEDEKFGYITPSALGAVYGTTNLTNYDYLVGNAYFKSTVVGGEAKNVEFKNILLKIKIIVADGRSFEHAYRVYDAESFNAIEYDKYYTVMTSLEIPAERMQITTFQGGLQAYNNDVTVKFAGANFAGTIDSMAEIRNIKFNGLVSGNGFIADVNKGKITNVTVDVDGISPSNLNSTGRTAGGLVGANQGVIDGGKVLGLNISAPSAVVGGIAGQNSGSIVNSAVEFYNLKTGEDGEGNALYGTNIFSGETVGAIVGEIITGSTISYTYAYDYSLSEESGSPLLASSGLTGAFAGKSTATSLQTTTIDYSFSVVGQYRPYGGYTNADPVTLTNYYYGYYSSGYQVIFVLNYESNPNFVQPSHEGFDSEVNGGYAYLSGLQQSIRIKTVDYSVATNEANGYYKSVAVDGDNGILFFYGLKNTSAELNGAQINDLAALNTITLSQLVGVENVSENIIITSSNISVIKVVGSSMVIRKTGEVTLTLSSKQNVQLNKTISVKIVSPLSKIIISWNDVSGNINNVEENSQISIQKTRSRDFAVSFARPQVFLGALASAYDIVENDYTLAINTDITENAVEYQVVNNKEFKLLVNKDSLLTKFTLAPNLFEEENYQTALNTEFTRTFKVLPTEGLISFAISGQTLNISPSINASVKVEIKTTAPKDGVYPVVSFKGVALEVQREANGNLSYFTLPGDSVPILEASVNTLSESFDSENGITTYVFDVTFAIALEYKTSVSQEYDFDVYLMSHSGNSSQEWNGNFTIHVGEQNFTNVDVLNKEVDYTRYEVKEVDGKGYYVEVYTTEVENTSVLAPGNSSILEINVNPSYAYYDYVKLSYSGAKVSNAVNMVVVEPFGDNGNKFTKKEISNNNIETINSELVFRPSANEKSTIYYKIWINTTVDRDTTLRFTATFCRNSGEVVNHVNYYMSISYLTEATIKVDGESTTYLAKGSYADVQIDVLLDQKVDNLILEGEDVKGISISQLSQPYYDYQRGVKSYTAKVYANVLASTADKNTFYLKARVSRMLNGSLEIKDAVATVVIVDFKLDKDGVVISNAIDGNVTIWQGVSKPFTVEYNILPDSYPYPSTEEMAKAIEKLRKGREVFEKYEYYPDQTEVTNDTQYLINYIYDKDSGKYQAQTLKQRLFVAINNIQYPIDDSSLELPFEIVESDDGNISLRGTKISGDIEMVLKTYITTNYVTQVIETKFKLKVVAYSDPDLPIKVSDASDFLNLNPENIGGAEQLKNDYILENDIVLENYIPFDTNLISSLDGNGHTIFIKSYNLDLEQASLNLALFKTVKDFTTLKNVRVNLYNGGQLTINVGQFKTVNIAGLAITNEGVITNSEVVSFYTTDSAYGITGLTQAACTPHNKPQGINVNYVNANGGDNVYLTDNSLWSTQVAGFVIENMGSITNSRVGGDEIVIVGADKLADGEATGYTYASSLKLDTFHIVGQGNVAGFALLNPSGYISTSFVKNIDIENQTNSISYHTSGFVGVNNSSIIASFVEGAPSVEENMPAAEYNKYAFEGTSIRSKLGYVVGFNYNNVGVIKDSYSNILIANSMEETRVYYASGFVYMNDGTVENSYSASQITNSKYTQMNFSGVNANGDLLKNGEYINCYFFNKAYANREDPDDFTTESQYSTGAQLIADPTDKSSFYGFAIADGELDGIWRIDEEKGITLIEANNLAISNRYTYYVDDKTFEGTTAEDEDGKKYILPYSILTFIDSNREINTALGGIYNPILVYDAQDFMEISGTSLSTYVQQYFNEYAMWGSYRLVNNINLLDVANGEETVALPSSNKAFAGRLYGNGFSITGVSISAPNQGVSFGLFKSIEKRLSSTPIVTNLDISLNQVIAGDRVMVGGLAGYIKDAIVINIEMNFNEDTSMVAGLNYVGSIAGLATGNNIIKNITVTNPKTHAERRADIGDEDWYFTNATQIQLFRTKLKNNLNYNTSHSSQLISEMSEHSYAGALIGYVDNYMAENIAFNISQADTPSINNIRIKGRVDVQGQIAGGIIGFTGYQTNVNDMGLSIDPAAGASKILSIKYFAGGAIGQSFGGVSRVFTSHDDTTQDLIEDNMSKFYQDGDTDVERGLLDIFSSGETNYTQEYIGGLIGYVGSGRIQISYSKLNVVSMSAKYAGGAIGGIEVSNNVDYKTNIDAADEDVFTKYLMHEVYASGDVRASTYAGGVIGVIKGEESHVAMLAVNSVNYFTAYDYVNDAYMQVNTSTNLSNLINANSLVGHLIKYVEEDGEKIEKIDTEVDMSNYETYLILMKAGETYTTSTSVTVRDVPSIGYYEGYYLNASGVLTTINLFHNFDGRVGDANELYKAGLVFAIARPLLYKDSITGHTYTQAGFINSGAWSSDSWVHNSIDLLPKIRYKKSYNVIYLDQYNIREVFAMMTNGNARVIVRGKVAEDSEEVGDIHVYDYFKQYAGYSNLEIEGFQGILQGGMYKVTQADGTIRDVKIITDRPFIKSTGPGFSINNVVIDYVQVDPNMPVGSGEASYENKAIAFGDLGLNSGGLLSQSDIADASISNLTMNLYAPVKIDMDATGYTNENVGLLTSSLVNTTIDGLTINFEGESSDAIMQLGNVEKSINAGIVAGSVEQQSTIGSMDFEDIKINATNFISISQSPVEPTSGGISAASLSSTAIAELNVGAYFGKLSRSAESQPIQIQFNELISVNDDVTGQIMINIDKIETLRLGGYVGLSYGVDNYTYNDEEDVNTIVDFVITSSSITNAYVGGVVGVIDGASINGSDISVGAVVKTVAYFDIPTTGGNLENLYAGGVVGGHSAEVGVVATPIKVSNFAEVDFEVASFRRDSYIGAMKEDEYPDKESLDGKYTLATIDGAADTDISRYVSVDGEANVGGIAGFATGGFEYSGVTMINKDGQVIRLKGNLINAGSVLGKAMSDVKIIGNVNSSAEFMIDSLTTASDAINIGGMVGLSASGNVVITGSNEGKHVFNGAVYSNSSSLVFGGMIANFTNSHESDDYIQIEKTGFGGVVKIYGTNSNGAKVTTGGTVGKIASTVPVRITQGYNFGDVFAEYGSGVERLSAYNFGGIIGDTSELVLSGSLHVENTAACGILGNYTIMTSHNSRYSTHSTDTAHALFGAGNPWGSNFDNIALNYYSHSACLLVDERGADIAYYGKYEKDGDGYNGVVNRSGSDPIKMLSKADTPIYQTIKSQMGTNITLADGHKLQPTSADATSEPITFNGMTWLAFGGVTGDQIKVNGSTELKNVAVVGATAKQIARYTEYSLIEKLSGYSTVSGIALEVKAMKEIDATNTFAPLARQMNDNSMVYAVNVVGSYEIGTVKGHDDQAIVTGLVGEFNSGKIFDCSTDVDLVFRAGAGTNSQVNALAYNNGNAPKIIENCFTAGSITTMVDVEIAAFAQGAGDASTSIQNCYTFTKLDPNNYTESTSGKYNSLIHTFGDSSSNKDIFYNLDGLNYSVSGVKGNHKLRSAFKSDKKWEVNKNFNYGYPTLRYNYLNVSSYAVQTSSTPKGTSGYDLKVIENTYARLANGEVPSDAESAPAYYYVVPNGGVLFDDEVKTKNIVLKYDIDLSINRDSALSDSFSGVNKQKTLGLWKDKIFDGQGKTISGMINSLTEDVNNATIRNVRLTDVKVENAMMFGEKIENNSTLSNITLSGAINYKVDEKAMLGSLAGAIVSSSVDTVTNMINLNVVATVQEQFRIGGLFGNMGSTSISYSSNYGAVTVSNEKGTENRVGGLIGCMDSGTIDHSFNAGAVLSGYTSSNKEVNTNSGTFRAGGIAGLALSGTISDSYNSGMIKAGNKSNTGKSYAGGIFGQLQADYQYATGFTINNCYNEGTVEALGANPGYKFEKDDDDIILVVDTSLERNVWAYSLGYISGEKDKHYSLKNFDSKFLDNDADSIKTNGNAFDKNDDEDDKIILDRFKLYAYTKKELGIDSINTHAEGTNQRATLDNIFGSAGKFLATGDFSTLFEANPPLNGLGALAGTPLLRTFDYDIYSLTDWRDIADIKVLSYNDYGMPSTFVIPTVVKVTVYNMKHFVERPAIEGGDYYENPDNFSVSINDQQLGMYKLTTDVEGSDSDFYHYTIPDSGNACNQNVNAGYYKAAAELKAATRSQEEAYVDINSIVIAGNTYYLADHNNATNVFNVGIISDTRTIEFENIPYIANKDLYTLTVDATDGSTADLKCRIISVEPATNPNNVMVEANIYTEDTTNGIPAKLTYELNLDYSEEVNFNLSSMAYSYVDNYSIGVDIDGINPTILKGYKLAAPTKTYDIVYKFSNVKYDNTNNFEPVDRLDKNFVYFAFDGTRYIYIPNATLKDDLGNVLGTVNKVTDPDINLDGSDLTKEKVQNLIATKLSSQTFYYRVFAGSTVQLAIGNKVSHMANGEMEIEFEGSTDIADTKVSYGEEIATNVNYFDVNYVSEEINVSGTPTVRNSYKLGLSDAFKRNFTRDALAVDMSSGNVVLSYLAADQSIGIDGSSTTMTIDGVDYTVSVEENLVIFESATITAEDSNVISAIKGYFNSLTYITENMSERVIVDNYSSYTARKITSINYGGKKIADITTQTDKVWNVDGSDISGEVDMGDYIIKLDGNNLVIAVNSASSSLASYQLNGITVRYGSVGPASITQKQTTKVTEAKIFVGFDVDSTKGSSAKYTQIAYYDEAGNKVKTVKDSLLASAENMIGEEPFKLATPTENEKYTLKVSFFTTYEEDSVSNEESGEYKLAFKDDAGSYWTEIDYSTDDLKIESLVFVPTGWNYGIEVTLREGNAVIPAHDGISEGTTAYDFTQYDFNIYGDSYDGFFSIAKFEDGTTLYFTYKVQQEPWTIEVEEGGSKVVKTAYGKEGAEIIYLKSGETAPSGYEVIQRIQQVPLDPSTSFAGLVAANNLYDDEDGSREYLSMYKKAGISLSIKAEKLVEVYEKFWGSKSQGTITNIDTATGAETEESVSAVLQRKEYFMGINRYYVFSQNFEVLDGMSWNVCKKEETAEGSTITVKYNTEKIDKTSSVVANKYNWQELGNLPVHSVEEKSSVVSTEITDETAINNSQFVTDANKITIFLKGADEDTIKLSIDKNVKQTQTDEAKTDGVPAAPIVLTQDIQFAEPVGFMNADNVNIIGNGYFISYHTNPFYSILKQNGAWFKDVMFLGEINGTSAASLFSESIGTGSTKLKFSNVDFHGIVNNFKQDYVILEAEANLDNCKTNVSVNGTLDDDLVLFNNASLDNCSNYGTIIGKDGDKGDDGKTSARTDKKAGVNFSDGGEAAEGSDGEAGQAIKATTGTGELTNHGIVKSGSGGNAGAGGTYKSGGEDSIEGLDPGEAGQGGEVEGFSYALDKIKGEEAEKGVTARASFGIEFDRTLRTESASIWQGNWDDWAKSKYYNYTVYKSDGTTEAFSGKAEDFDLTEGSFLKTFIKNYVFAFAYTTNAA